MFGTNFLHASGHIGWMAMGRAQHHEALLLRWKVAVADPSRLLRSAHAGKALGFYACSIPDTSLAKIDADTAMVVQLDGKLIKNESCSIRLADGINIIQEGKKVLPWPQRILHSPKRGMLAQCVESGHEGVALLPPLCLDDGVRSTQFIIP